jgi:hypothetical protein
LGRPTAATRRGREQILPLDVASTGGHSRHQQRGQDEQKRESAPITSGLHAGQVPASLSNQALPIEKKKRSTES